MSMRVRSLAVLVIAALTAASIGISFLAYGHLNALYCLLSLFLSINIVICYWEACLFWRRSYIEKRAEFWRERRGSIGRSAAAEFLASRVPLRQCVSPTFWADVWGTYALYDGSYADRRTVGFNADVCNGFFTAVPTLVLHATYTVAFLPAVTAGILGVMLFWQWTYVTSVYYVSFFVAGRQKLISRSETLLYIWGASSPWVIFSLLGLYVSIRLIVDGDYSVLGHR